MNYASIMCTCVYLCFIRFWDLSAKTCKHVLRYFQSSLDPNSQILSCEFMQKGKDKKMAIGTYDGCVYIAYL